MTRLNGVGSYLNYFNNLVNNQIVQNRTNNTINNTSQPSEQKTGTTTAEEISPELSSALSSLAGLLSSSKTQNPNTGVVSQVSKLIGAGADIEKLQSAMESIAEKDNDDILYTRTNENDPNITNQNKQIVIGADMQAFLNQANMLVADGKDVNKYIDAVSKVMEKGDYDDLKRFISVVNTANSTDQNLDVLYNFSNEVMDKRHYDHESNMFSVQTMMLYGTSLDNAVKIMRQMENTGLEGRNNMVDLNRVMIDARNKGAFLPLVFHEMAKSGDSRGFMDAYMKSEGMKTTAPDFNKFKRIERIDGEDMVIKQGESAALFSQAISSQDGLLPESVLHWSSLQTGAISKGSSYLDLSKLEPGTYDIYVKIGPGYGGTDTAKKRVVVLPKDEISDPLVLNQDGKLKITVEKGSAGLDSDLFMKMFGKDEELITKKAQTNTGFTLETDYKAGDMFDFFIKTHGESWGLGTYEHGTNKADANDGKKFYQKEQLSENSWRIKFEDLPENKSDWDYNDVVIKVELIPNKKKAEPIVNVPSYEIPKVKNNNGLGDTKDIDNAVKFTDTSNPGHNKKESSKVATQSQLSAYSQYQSTTKQSNVDKMERLIELIKPKMKSDDFYNYLDEKIGKEKVCRFLDDVGQTSLSKKYEKRKVEWLDSLLAIGKDPDFFKKASDEFRRYVEKDEARKFFEKRCSQSECNESLKIMGYSQDLNITEQFKIKPDNVQKNNSNDSDKR
jgi:hypothetical protein